MVTYKFMWSNKRSINRTVEISKKNVSSFTQKKREIKNFMTGLSHICQGDVKQINK